MSVDTPAKTACPRVGRTRVPRALLAMCAVAAAVCGAWALWPVPVSLAPSEPHVLATPEAPAAHTLAALDLDAFRAPIWVAPPPPPEPEKPAPPPPPLKLQLLAILNESGVYKAALYDPDTDKILVVEAGQTLGHGRAVESVTAETVSVRDSRGVRTLALREDRP